MRINVTRKRVKNVNFRVCQDGTARMSIPWAMPLADAERVARGHADWLRRSIRKVTEAAADAPRSWETGDRLMIWGEPHVLSVEHAGGRPCCELHDGVLVVRVPEQATAQTRALAVEQWLADQLRERVCELLPACEKRVGRQVSHVTLRRMKTRWGSCTPKTARIRLNVALAECPPKCLEMVVVHELCHLLESNHGPRFHAMMDLHCPDWRATQRWLDEHPPRYPAA